MTEGSIIDKGLDIDNLIPKDITLKAENVGVLKANLDLFTLTALAIMAGVFISLGSAFFTVAIAGNGVAGAIKLPAGIIRIVGGIVFGLGLILVVIAGAELFTGNVLIIMAAASKKITIGKVLRNWSVVYTGNFIGSVITAYLVYKCGQYKLLDGIFGVQALSIANGKCAMPFIEAMTRGILCNALVCLAIWLCFSGRTVVDKITGIIFPVTAFVAMGFEHCVANMYLVPVGIFIKTYAGPEFWLATGKTAAEFSVLTWKNLFIVNLLPVSIGNTIGGFMIGLMYWVIYDRSNILNTENQKELLKKLIGRGRRKFERHDAEGVVTIYRHLSSFKGLLKNISEGGLLCTLDKNDLTAGTLERITLDIESEMVSGHESVKKTITGLSGRLINISTGASDQVDISI